jgi:hypothetical protein
LHLCSSDCTCGLSKLQDKINKDQNGSIGTNGRKIYLNMPVKQYLYLTNESGDGKIGA